MRLISWNVQGRVDVCAQLDAIATREPDLVALQEVTLESLGPWKKRLNELGLGEQEDTSLLLATPAAYGEYNRKYFNLVASRWDLARLAQLPFVYPERYLAVTVAHSKVALDLHVAHVPPGVSRELIKVEMFEALFNGLSVKSVRPRILCGDFNTPKREHADGSVEFWDGSHARADRERWQNAERSIILGLTDHDLPDVFRSLHGYSASPRSWIHQGVWRRYDHVFASRSLDADSCIYHEEWLDRGLSDHAAIEATFEID